MVLRSGILHLVWRASPITSSPQKGVKVALNLPQAIASTSRDIILAGVLFSLAIGTTITCSLFANDNGANVVIKVAAYVWILSSLLAW